MRENKLDAVMNKAGKVFFVGIGGISMSSLAFITKSRGYDVSGSDRTESDMTHKMEKHGITVFYAHEGKNAEGASAVVYTAAVPKTNPELVYAKEHGIPAFTRGEYLGHIMKEYKNRIGVSGTHGKSSVTSMLAEIYMAGSYDPTVISGAELTSMDGAYRLGSLDYFIFEACEYCDSFLDFYPTTAIVTNLEYDHADYFKNMEQMRASFRKYVGYAEKAVLNADDSEALALKNTYNGNAATFSISSNGDYNAENIVYENGCGVFDVVKNGEVLAHIQLNVVGEHNVKNAVCAAAAAFENGANKDAVEKGLNAFRGAKRRFEYVGKTQNGALVYNDYAHHPSELSATLSAAKALNKRIVAVFQPHTYSRTASLFDDFVKAFEKADLTVFADIYAARETDTLGMSSELLSKKTPNSLYLDSFEKIEKYLKESCGAGDVILILGAGDIVKLGNMIA